MNFSFVLRCIESENCTIARRTFLNGSIDLFVFNLHPSGYKSAIVLVESRGCGNKNLIKSEGFDS